MANPTEPPRVRVIGRLEIGKFNRRNEIVSTHMTQFSYSTASMKGMVSNPQNRREAATKIFAAAGGRLDEMYFCFGDYDGVVLATFPSNVDAAAALLAVGSTGAFSSIKTTTLISMDESVAAMERAKAVVDSYTPPSG